MVDRLNYLLEKGKFAEVEALLSVCYPSYLRAESILQTALTSLAPPELIEKIMRRQAYYPEFERCLLQKFAFHNNYNHPKLMDNIKQVIVCMLKIYMESDAFFSINHYHGTRDPSMSKFQSYMNGVVLHMSATHQSDAMDRYFQEVHDQVIQKQTFEVYIHDIGVIWRQSENPIRRLRVMTLPEMVLFIFRAELYNNPSHILIIYGNPRRAYCVRDVIFRLLKRMQGPCSFQWTAAQVREIFPRQAYANLYDIAQVMRQLGKEVMKDYEEQRPSTTMAICNIADMFAYYHVFLALVSPRTVRRLRVAGAYQQLSGDMFGMLFKMLCYPVSTCPL